MSTPLKLHFIENFSEGAVDLQLCAIKKIFNLVPPEEADIFLFASIFKIQEARRLIAQHNKPLAIYCWDYYEWVHNKKMDMWIKYAEIMKEADVIMVPSHEQQLALKNLLGLDSVVVKSGVYTSEHEITDEDFVLDPLRYYPFEEARWAERAGAELGIKVIHSEHRYSLEEFKKLVASCTFMTTCVPEASTGALTLSEGLWLGKPSLVSDAPYQGAKSYLGEFGTYFKHGDYDDFKREFERMWTERPKIDIIKARKYMEKELSFDSMAKGIYDACLSCTSPQPEK